MGTAVRSSPSTMATAPSGTRSACRTRRSMCGATRVTAVPHRFGDPFHRTARRRTAVVGLHVLLGTAHMVFRVPQHDPQAKGGRRAFHQARLKL